MEHVLGFGGFFFKADDPESLADWYSRHLGVKPTPSGPGDTPWMQEGGPTAFQPFERSTTMFPNAPFMLNFRVRDLDAMVAQLRAAAIEVTVDPESYSMGRFAELADPAGNPIQLWQQIDNPG